MDRREQLPPRGWLCLPLLSSLRSKKPQNPAVAAMQCGWKPGLWLPSKNGEKEQSCSGPTGGATGENRSGWWTPTRHRSPQPGDDPGDGADLVKFIQGKNRSDVLGVGGVPRGVGQREGAEAALSPRHHVRDHSGEDAASPQAEPDPSLISLINAPWSALIEVEPRSNLLLFTRSGST